MFARIKKSGKYQYLQIVENKKVNGKVKQRVISTIGRLDHLHEKGRVETLIRSLSRYSEKVILILSGSSEVDAQGKKIGPALIFERLWRESGINEALTKVLSGRKFEFDVERALFLTVLHRLMVSGSDRSCERWRRDYKIAGVTKLHLHQLYRAMAFLGKAVADQKHASPFSPRCVKDLVEEEIFSFNRDLFSDLQLVFFDTTSMYFEGAGGETLGELGFSKDHRPDLRQMVIGVGIDRTGRPIFCEMWPGNTTDVKTLIPITESLRKRFHITQFCIVADRGMISKDTIKTLESPSNTVPYILGTRMRNVNEVKKKVLSRGGRYREVREEGQSKTTPASLKVKEVIENGSRYIVCLNPSRAKKDALDRKAIVDSLEKKLKGGATSLVGNKGYRKYVKISKGAVRINDEKVQSESRFDGKWVLQTNTDLSAEEVALKYKELWLIERVFRDIKSLFETRPIFHKCDETIRGHVFCSFLALILRKELEKKLEKQGHVFEWGHIKQDLEALVEVEIKENGCRMAVRSRSLGVCGKVFQAVGVAMPATIREIE